MFTPWGISDSSEPLAPGITFYGTPSHGGYHLSKARQAAMPDALRCDRWYEEDCDWARVAIAFSEYFSDEDVGAAWNTLANWCPTAYEAFTGQRLQPEQSYLRRRVA